MAVVRFSRDRRGYEHTYLVEVGSRGGTPTRLLYWFRTPPGVKLGREPFDEATRRELEAQHPDVRFDWKSIVATPMPPPTIDWRSRRRADRATKVAHKQVEAAFEPQFDAESGDSDPTLDGVLDELARPGDNDGGSDEQDVDDEQEQEQEQEEEQQEEEEQSAMEAALLADLGPEPETNLVPAREANPVRARDADPTRGQEADAGPAHSARARRRRRRAGRRRHRRPDRDAPGEVPPASAASVEPPKTVAHTPGSAAETPESAGQAGASIEADE